VLASLIGIAFVLPTLRDRYLPLVPATFTLAKSVRRRLLVREQPHRTTPAGLFEMGGMMSRAQIGVVVGVIVSTTALGVVPDLARAQDGVSDGAIVLDDPSVQREDGGEDLDRKIRSLRWGVATSAVAIPLGTGLFLGGAASCSVNGIFSDPSCSTGQKAAMGIGVGLMIAGTAGMIASAILLRRRKQERKRLQTARRLHWDDASGSFVF
jgi:hypothetical protein